MDGPLGGRKPFATPRVAFPGAKSGGGVEGCLEWGLYSEGCFLGCGFWVVFFWVFEVVGCVVLFRLFGSVLSEWGVS